MNIALTGSSGSIGSHLLKDLKNMGHEVMCISSSYSSSQDNVFLYEELDSNKINFNADFLIHLASINSNLKEKDIPQEVNLINKITNIMDKLECKNIIFFSSIKVYGENSFNFNFINEDFPKHPQCFYGKAKAECEKVLINSSGKKKFNYLIFRMPPVLMNNPGTNLGKLFKLVEMGLPIPSFRIGDLNQRSFLNYDLLAHVLKEILIKEKILKSNIFNLCDTEAVSTNNLLKRFGKSINKKSRIIYLPDFLFTAMIRINSLQLILCRLFGNFYLSNANLRKAFNLPRHF
tara:strand:- start:3026 stop:3895 length:870 start_codon:yes stop_codon:yes gene_type:complete